MCVDTCVVDQVHLEVGSRVCLKRQDCAGIEVGNKVGSGIEGGGGAHHKRGDKVDTGGSGSLDN
jgi:hypothetical protein